MGKITIQLIPLSKLGDEQLDNIRKLNSSNPCLINSKSKRIDKALIIKIKDGVYTHILLSPKQALLKSFQNTLKSIELQARVSLITINKCYLVKQQEMFQPAFTILGELRTILYQDIVWFNYSTTLNKEVEQLVLSNAGFRSIGNRIYQTKVIRTSIDRPNVLIYILPLSKGKVDLQDVLYFLLNAYIDLDTAVPEQIPKTIIFMDGCRSVQEAAVYL